MQDLKTKIAHDLLAIKAVFFRPEEPFTWASGIKSPVYGDNRLILSDVEARECVEAALAETVRTAFPDCEILMGTATAGIAHAAIAAQLLRLPTGYVRGGAKDHGRNNRIEGKLEKGEKAVVVEDLISTAGSSVESAEALREAGAEVLGVVSIFTYGMRRGLERLREAGLRSVSLTDFDTLVSLAAETGYIEREDVSRLLRFRDEPSDESWMEGKQK